MYRRKQRALKAKHPEIITANYFKYNFLIPCVCVCVCARVNNGSVRRGKNTQ